MTLPDAWIARDPGLIRLRSSLWAALSAAASLLVCYELAEWFHLSSLVISAGTNVSILVAISATDVVVADQKKTTLWAIAVGTLAFIIAGRVIAASLGVANVCFVALVYLAVWLKQFGPRPSALGLMAFLAWFAALAYRTPIEILPSAMLGCEVGGLLAFLIRFYLLPETPTGVIRYTLVSFHAQIRLVLKAVSQVLRTPSKRGDEAVRQSMAALNVLALSLDQLLEGRDETARSLVLNLELATGNISNEGRERAAVGAEPAGAELLDAFRRSLSTGQPTESGFHPWGDRIAASWDVAVPDVPIYEPYKILLQSFGALDADESRRQALQATIAGALCVLAGLAISDTRFYWSVVAGFLVFNQTRTAGDILSRAVARVFGTLVGVVVGLLVVDKLQGHEALQLTAFIGGVFAMYYCLRISYAWFVTFLTIVLCLVYSLLGRYSHEVMELRLELTLVGCVVGVVTGLVVRPVSSRSRARTLAADILDLAAEDFRHGFTAVRSEWLVEARRLDQSLLELRRVGTAMTGIFIPVEAGGVAHLVRAVADFAYAVRHLGAALSHPDGPSSHPKAFDAMAERCAQAASALRAPSTNPVPPIEPATEAPDETDRISLWTYRSGTALDCVTKWLERWNRPAQ